MDIKNCLSASEMEVISTVFIECFESENLKLSNESSIKIDSFLLDLYSKLKLHTLFTSNGLKVITEQVFNDSDIRDFILCLTDQFKCITALSDLENRSIEYSIGYGLDIPKFADSEFILIPQRVYDNLESSGELIFSILSSNRWLLTLVLIYLFFQKTTLYASVSVNNKLVNK